MPRIVVLESPYKGKNSVRGDIEYARKCRRDCFFNHGEVPIFSHLLSFVRTSVDVTLKPPTTKNLWDLRKRWY